MKSLDIIYLDDEPDLCDVISEFCAIGDINVRTFTDHELAIAACREAPPDIFFIDYRLRGTTGDAVAQRLPESIVKVIVTGELAPPSAEVFAYLLKKPFTLGKFLDVIEECSAARSG